MPGDPTVFYRRVSPHPSNWHEDNDGTVRVSSGAFRDKNGVSVWDGAVCSAEEVRGDNPSMGVWAISKDALKNFDPDVIVKPFFADGEGHYEIHTKMKKLANRISETAKEVLVGERPPPREKT